MSGSYHPLTVARITHGLSERQTASLLSTSVSKIIDIEAGEIFLPDRLLNLICTVFRLSKRAFMRDCEIFRARQQQIKSEVASA